MRQVTRVTIALPKDLWEAVKRAVPSGKRSGLVAEALESELRRRRGLEGVMQLRQYQAAMRGKYGEMPSSAEELDRMRQERVDERNDVR